MHFVVQNPKSVPAPQRLGNSTKASTLKLPGYPTSHKLHFENSPLTLFPPSSSIPSTSRLAVLKAGGWLMGRPLATSKPRICAEAEHHRLLMLPRLHAGCLRSDLAGLEFGAPSGACMAGSRNQDHGQDASCASGFLRHEQHASAIVLERFNDMPAPHVPLHFTESCFPELTRQNAPHQSGSWRTHCLYYSEHFHTIQ